MLNSLTYSREFKPRAEFSWNRRVNSEPEFTTCCAIFYKTERANSAREFAAFGALNFAAQEGEFRERNATAAFWPEFGAEFSPQLTPNLRQNLAVSRIRANLELNSRAKFDARKPFKSGREMLLELSFKD